MLTFFRRACCKTVVLISTPVCINVCMFRLGSADSATLCGNLEEILTFQQGLCVALEDCTKYVTLDTEKTLDYSSFSREPCFEHSVHHPVLVL